MILRKIYIFLFAPLAIVILLCVGCSDYNKLLKSSDYPKKYEAAIKYYEKGNYDRALALMEELITAYRGTDKAEKIAYYIAYCNYNLGYYELASFYFKNFVRTFPLNMHAEECSYMTAYCFYLTSPVYSLDQSDTKTAIKEFQLFINQYSDNNSTAGKANHDVKARVELNNRILETIAQFYQVAGYRQASNAFRSQVNELPVDRIEKANEIIQKLRDKLERKSYENAKQYYNLGEYQAAVVAFTTMQKDFPDTKYKEEVSFLAVKACYLLAINSIDQKKLERYSSAMDYYLKFSNAFPNSEYMKAATDIYENASKQKQKLLTLNKS